MREIKFRGKPTENNTSYIEEGAFVYGALIVCDNKYYIALNVNDNINRDDYEVYMIEVIPETVGQYTGLKDKNKEEIYEGDIIHINDKFLNKNNYAILWNQQELGYYLFATDLEKVNHIGGILYAHLDGLDVTVIGNIYDNPEM